MLHTADVQQLYSSQDWEIRTEPVPVSVGGSSLMCGRNPTKEISSGSWLSGIYEQTSRQHEVYSFSLEPVCNCA
jgi:hypothetical protein